MALQHNQEKVSILFQKIEEADVIIVGGASGLSTASGYDWYQNESVMWEDFGEFERTYHVKSLWEALYHDYSDSEKKWGYLSKLITFLYNAEPGQTYLDLYEVIGEKDYFIATTNQDFQFVKVFPEEKISLLQGDWRYFQCKSRCHDQVYQNNEFIQKISSHLKGTAILSEHIPKCKECGKEMAPWIRSSVFLEGSFWFEQISKFQLYIMKNKYRKILFLELGVGSMTPQLIKEPFWEMTNSLPNAFYVSVNAEDVKIPKKIEGKSLFIQEDIALILRDLAMKKRQLNLFHNYRAH